MVSIAVLHIRLLKKTNRDVQLVNIIKIDMKINTPLFTATDISIIHIQFFGSFEQEKV